MRVFFRITVGVFALLVASCGGDSNGLSSGRGSSEESRDGMVGNGVPLDIIDSDSYYILYPVNYDPEQVRIDATKLIQSYNATMSVAHLSMSYLYKDVGRGRFTSIYDTLRDEHRGMFWTLNNLCDLGLSASGFIEQYGASECKVYSFLPAYDNYYMLVIASQYNDLEKQTTFTTDYVRDGYLKGPGSVLSVEISEGVLSLERKVIWYTPEGYQQEDAKCTLLEVLADEDMAACAELVAESLYILDEAKSNLERGADRYIDTE